MLWRGAFSSRQRKGNHMQVIVYAAVSGLSFGFMIAVAVFGSNPYEIVKISGLAAFGCVIGELIYRHFEAP